MGYVEFAGRRPQASFVDVLSQLIECSDSLGLTQINAMQVLNQSQLERIRVRHIALDCPDTFFSSEFRGTPPSFAGDDLITGRFDER